MQASSPIPVVLRCSACDSLLIDPVELQPCGHIVCRSCVLEADAGAYLCPVFPDDPEEATMVSVPSIIQDLLNSFVEAGTIPGVAAPKSIAAAHTRTPRRGNENIHPEQLAKEPAHNVGTAPGGEAVVEVATCTHVNGQPAAATPTQGQDSEVLPSDDQDASYLWDEYSDNDRAANEKGKRALQHLLHLSDERVVKQVGLFTSQALTRVRSWVTTKTPKFVVDTIEQKYQKICRCSGDAPGTQTLETGTCSKEPRSVVGAQLGGEDGQGEPAQLGGEDGQGEPAQLGGEDGQGEPARPVCPVEEETPLAAVAINNNAEQEKLLAANARVRDPCSEKSTKAVTLGNGAVVTGEDEGTTQQPLECKQMIASEEKKERFLWPQYTDADREANTKGKRGLEILLQTTDDVKLSNCLSNYSVSALDGVRAWVTTKTPKNVVKAIRKRYKELKPAAAVPKGTTAATTEDAGNSQSVKFLWSTYTDADRENNPSGKRTLEDHLLKMTEQQIDKHLSNFSLDALVKVCAWVTTATPKHVVNAIKKRYNAVNTTAVVSKGTAATKVQSSENGQSVKFLWPEYTDADRTANPKGKRGIDDTLLKMVESKVHAYVSEYSMKAVTGVRMWVTVQTPKYIVDAIEARYRQLLREQK